MKKILLLLLLVLGVTGCSNQEVGDLQLEKEEGTKVAAAADRELLESDFGQMDNLQLIDSICYYTRYEMSAEEDIILLHCCRMELDGPEEIIYTYEADSGNSFYLLQTCCDVEGNWYNLYRKNVQGKDALYLEKLSALGEVIFCRQAETYENVIYMEGYADVSADTGGQFCLLTRQGSLLVWDQAGEEAGKITARTGEEDAVSSGLLNGSDMGIYLYRTGRDSISVSHVDLESMVFEKAEEVKLSASAAGYGTEADYDAYETITVYDGYSGFCYIADAENLYCYSFTDRKIQRLFAWSDSYVNIDRNQLKQVGQQDDGWQLFCYDTALAASSCVTVQLKEQEELSDKTVITLGCSDSIGLESQIKRYNSQSEQYRIEIQTYQVNGPMDELVEALLLGNGPDIIDFKSLSVDYYASKGILEDLGPYLAESGIELVKQIEDILQTDGKLYALSESFTIRGYAVPLEYDSGGGLSIQQCIDMARDYPDSSPIRGSNSRVILLYAMLVADLDTYVDFESGTCDFISEKFIQLLEAASTWKNLQDTSGSTQALDGFIQKQYLMLPVTIGSMSDYLIFKNTFQEYASFAGYPNYQGEMKYYLSMTNYYGINSASENKDGAWDFIKYLLSDYEQSRTGIFPVTQEAYEKSLEKQADESTFIINQYTGDREEACSPQQKDIDEVREIVDHLYYFDHIPASVLQIILEEAEAVFDQSKTAGQAAEIIQGRVSLFLQE